MLFRAPGGPRDTFIKDLGNNHVAELEKAGFSPSQVKSARAGFIPNDWEVHHVIGLGQGGSNDQSNLLLIKNDKHALITGQQNSAMAGMVLNGKPHEVDVLLPPAGIKVYGSGKMTTKSETLSSWLEPVSKFLAVERKVTEEQPEMGASEEQIARFRSEATVHSLYVDEQYVEFLRFVNGVSFDGLSFASTRDQDSREGNSRGIAFYNPLEDDVTGGDATYYGTNDDFRYRYLRSARKFQEVDDALGVAAEFDRFSELVEYVFSDWLKSRANG